MKNIYLTAFAFSSLVGSVSAEELRIYNWSDYIAEDTIKKFEAKTDIKIIYDVYDSNEILEAKLLAGSSGYDIVVPTTDFLQRQIKAGIYQKLDKSKLPNLVHMDKDLMKSASSYDQDNAHSVIYLWGTTGIGYNVAKIKERLGADYIVNSWDLVFNPEIAAKLADCGITMLDAPTEIVSSALNYLKLDPSSEDKADLAQVSDLLKKIRPHVRYFHSSQYINDLANGDICVSIGWSGDIALARERASEAGKDVEVSYVIPKEGALQWFDMLAIPADASNVDAAHKFINFIMDPQITADITNYVWYASANKSSLPMINPEIIADEGIFPPDNVKENLFPATVKTPKGDRSITRLWTRVTTGQ